MVEVEFEFHACGEASDLVPHFEPYPAALTTGSSDPSDFYPQQLLDRGTGTYRKC